MSKKKAVIIASLICLIIGTGLGMILRDCSYSDPLKDNDNQGSVVIPDSLIKEETNKIDSLKEVIESREELISRLKDSIQIKEVIRTIQIDNVKKLPLDSAVMFLNSKLREYEDKY